MPLGSCARATAGHARSPAARAAPLPPAPNLILAVFGEQFPIGAADRPAADVIENDRDDQTLSAALHGEALLTARRPELQPLIDHLREVAQGRDDIRVECAGTIAGWWFADTARRGEELIAAGLLMLAGHVDLDELDTWVRIGWERRRGADILYGPTS
jgi:hypothetical protein